MKQFLECCAGIDIGKREMTVTILTGSVEGRKYLHAVTNRRRAKQN